MSLSNSEGRGRRNYTLAVMMRGLRLHRSSMSKAHSKQSKPGFVRIIGGTWRRHRIAIPAGANLRPTPDRVRETLFNWLSAKLPGAHCLDLYAGTGVLGFEALSRGAARAVMVEHDAGAAEALEQTRLVLDCDAEIVCVDAREYLQRNDIARFDIVFVDPPYSEAVDVILESILPLLKPGSTVYLERARGEEWPAHAGFDWSRRASAGGVDYGLASVGT